MPEPIAGTVRLSPEVRAQVDAYAEELGTTYNVAMNMLVRAGLKAEQTKAKKGR